MFLSLVLPGSRHWWVGLSKAVCCAWARIYCCGQSTNQCSCQSPLLYGTENSVLYGPTARHPETLLVIDYHIFASTTLQGVGAAFRHWFLAYCGDVSGSMQTTFYGVLPQSRIRICSIAIRYHREIYVKWMPIPPGLQRICIYCLPLLYLFQT